MNEILDINFFWNNTSDLAAVISFDGKLLDVNHMLLEKLGYTRDEVINKPFTMLLVDDDHERSIIELKKNTTGKASNWFEVQHKTKNGNVIWVSVVTVPDMEKGFAYALGRDITHIKEAEKKTIEARDVIETAVKLAPTGLGIYEVIEQEQVDVKYLMVSQEYCSITGYSAYELIGHNWSEFEYLKNEKQKEIIQHFLSKGKTMKNYEVELSTRTGETKSLNVSFQRVICSNKDYLIASLVDITDINKVYKRVDDQNKLLESSNEKLERKSVALSETVESMVHERKKSEQTIYEHLNAQLEPIISKLKLSKVDEDIVKTIEAIIDSLNKSDSSALQDALKMLSSKELELVHLIRKGYSSKEIANLMKIGYNSIESYRKNVRKKFGLQNSSVNLKTYLQSL